MHMTMAFRLAIRRHAICKMKWKELNEEFIFCVCVYQRAKIVWTRFSLAFSDAVIIVVAVAVKVENFLFVLLI